MLIHPLAERMRGIGLAAMADAFLEMQSTAVANDLSREDWLGLLLDREATNRENKRLGHRLIAPDLAELGFRLMGGRLLPADSGPAAHPLTTWPARWTTCSALASPGSGVTCWKSQLEFQSRWLRLRGRRDHSRRPQLPRPRDRPHR